MKTRTFGRFPDASVSSWSLAPAHPRSARSIAPSPSLSFPSAHAGTTLAVWMTSCGAFAVASRLAKIASDVTEHVDGCRITKLTGPPAVIAEETSKLWYPALVQEPL